MYEERLREDNYVQYWTSYFTGDRKLKKEEIEAKPAYVKSVQLDSTLLLFSARLFLAEQSNFPLFSVIDL